MIINFNDELYSLVSLHAKPFESAKKTLVQAEGLNSARGLCAD